MLDKESHERSLNFVPFFLQMMKLRKKLQQKVIRLLAALIGVHEQRETPLSHVKKINTIVYICVCVFSNCSCLFKLTKICNVF